MIEKKPIQTILDHLSDHSIAVDLLSKINFAFPEKAYKNISSIINEPHHLDIFAHFADYLFDKIISSADPDMALNNLERFFTSSINRDNLFYLLDKSNFITDMLIAVFSTSQFLSDILCRNPEYLDWLIFAHTLSDNKYERDYISEVDNLLSTFKKNETKYKALCRYRRKEILRIGIRDILKIADLKTLTAELSYLANTITDTALQICYEELCETYGQPIIEGKEAEECSEENICQFAIIAMGKLGGNELNFSSDIDLIFVYENEGNTTGVKSPDGRTSRSVTNHIFFSKLCERITKFISDLGPEGRLYIVDTRLRPEGKYGPLARSLESYYNFYQTQARVWEKFALLKAKPIAGGKRARIGFMKIVRDFMYKREVFYDVKSEMARLKAMIDGQLLQTAKYKKEVKRGYGGIREIEFVLGTIQMLMIPIYPNLADISNTFVLLDTMLDGFLITKDEYKTFTNAYIFLRDVEHRLQIMYERQTHLLPDEDEELRKLGLRMNMGFEKSDKPAEKFKEYYKETTDKVHDVFAKFFNINKKDDQEHKADNSLILLDNSISADEKFQYLSKFRFTQKDTLNAITALARGTSESFISVAAQKRFEEILPTLLSHCEKVSFPDDAVKNLEYFLEVSMSRTYFYDVIANNNKIFEIIIKLFGTSNYFSRLFTAHPEYLDEILDSEALYSPIDENSAVKFLLEKVSKMESITKKKEYLCFYNNLQLLKIVIKDLSGGQQWQDTISNLSLTARICVKAAYEIIIKEMKEIYGVPRNQSGEESTFSIIGVGKFGGGEINYHSDLDLVFIYDQDGFTDGAKQLDNFTFYFKVCEGIRKFLSDASDQGILYKIDSRLRPEGRNAPITAPLERFENYYKGNAQLWEFQSILRASHICGDQDLSDRLLNYIHNLIPILSEKADIKNEITDMREKLEQSIEYSENIAANFKRGKGGIVDIEFIVQYLQLKNYSKYNDIINSNTVISLDLLAKHSLLSSKNYEDLKKAYVFFRILESRIRLISETAEDNLPEDQSILEPLELSMPKAFDTGVDLKDYCLNQMKLTREIFNEILY